MFSKRYLRFSVRSVILAGLCLACLTAQSASSKAAIAVAPDNPGEALVAASGVLKRSYDIGLDAPGTVRLTLSPVKGKALLCGLTLTPLHDEDVFSAEFIKSVMRRVNRRQQLHPWKEQDRNWIRSTFYTGVVAAYSATEEKHYLDQALAWARKHNWQPGTEKSGANRLTCGQTYLQLSEIKQDPAMIGPLVEWLNSGDPKTPSGAKLWYLESERRYADSLYVGPPTLAMAAKATGDRKYIEYMDAMFRDVYNELFDLEAGLFYRDHRFRYDPVGEKSKPLAPEQVREQSRTWVHSSTHNGRKVIWSRGNGWVVAGIARILQYLPQNDPLRDFYSDLFRTMAASLAQRQGADGLWRVNLDDPKQYPNPETSGTGFFCYAMAWGINNGLLDADKYGPVVRNAWQGLVNCVSPEGKIQWGQKVGGGPFEVQESDSHEYVSGTFLLAGSEMLKLTKHN